LSDFIGDIFMILQLARCKLLYSVAGFPVLCVMILSQCRVVFIVL